MSRGCAALAVAIVAFGVEVSLDLGTQGCSQGESWDESESDTVTLMQKVHSVQHGEPRVAAKVAVGKQPPLARRAGTTDTSPLARPVAAPVPFVAVDEVALFQDPVSVEAAVKLGAWRTGAVAATAVASAAVQASDDASTVTREDAMAEELGEKHGAAFAKELAAAAVDGPVPEARAEKPAWELLSLSVLQESAQESSMMSLRHVKHARDSVIRMANVVASGNPVVFALSAVSILVIGTCIAGALVSSFSSHTGHLDAGAKPLAAEARMVGDVRGMTEQRGSAPHMLSKSAEAAVPAETFQSRRVSRAGGGSQSGSPRVTEPLPFYANPPEQGGRFQTGFREGAPQALQAGSSPRLGQQPWSQQFTAPASSANVLPALCPLLVLPACESHFAVPFDMLRINTVPFEFDIVGLSQTPLLHTCVRQAGNGGRSLEISMVKHYSWNGNSPHATVLPVQGDGSGKLTFEVLGHGRQVFGSLQLAEPGDPARYVLTREGQLVLTIHKDEHGQTIHVLNASGAAVCSVEHVDDFGGAKHLQFRVPAGVDAVLVLSCVLSTFVLFR